MKLVLSDINYLKSSIEIIHGLVIEARFNFNKEGISLLSMDPASVCFIYFKLLKSAFNTYDLDNDLDICLKVIDLKNVLKKSSETDLLVIEYNEPILTLTLKGKTKKIFDINTIELEDNNIKEPNLKFDCNISTKSLYFKEAVNTCDINNEGESVIIKVDSEKLTFSSEHHNNKATNIIKTSKDVEIKCEKESETKISIDYLKKIVEGCKLSDEIELSISNDYPFKISYKIPNKVQLWFLIAPRVSNE